MECIIGEENAYDLYRRYGKTIGDEKLFSLIQNRALLIATAKNRNDMLYNLGRIRALAHAVGYDNDLSSIRYRGEYAEYNNILKELNNRSEKCPQ